MSQTATKPKIGRWKPPTASVEPVEPKREPLAPIVPDDAPTPVYEPVRQVARPGADRYRFTKYKGLESCDRLIELMGRGYSKTASAGIMGTSLNAFDDWAKLYPEFADALELGKYKRIAYWERRGIILAETDKGNPAMTIFGLKNVNPNDWRDRYEHDVMAAGFVAVAAGEIGEQFRACMEGALKGLKPAQVPLIDRENAEDVPAE